MDVMQYNLILFKKRFAQHELLRNKIVTLMTFIFLMTSILLINIHPFSVWYYFLCGFFLCRILGAIFNKTKIKSLLIELEYKLEKIKEEFTK